jgi:hypothetical protein
MDPKEIGCKLDSTGSGYVLVVASIEHGDETSSTVQGRCDYHLLKKTAAS